MRLDNLAKLKNKKKVWITPKHPLYFESYEFKLIYCTGIFLQAGLSKEVVPLNNFELTRLYTKGFGLNGKDMMRVMKGAKNSKDVIGDLLEILTDDLKKQIFILDLYQVSIHKDGFSSEELQSISIMAQLLQVNENLIKLFLSYIQEAYAFHADNCIKLYAAMRKEKTVMTISELKYYIPEIEFVTRIDSKIMKQGAELRLVDNCEINDTIVVPAGTTLTITNAVLTMKGSIIVDGGTLIVRDSIFKNQRSLKEGMIQILNYSKVEIFHTVFDGNNMGRVLNQKNGTLVMKDCKIYHTTNGSAVSFWGTEVQIEHCIFEDCFTVRNGAAIRVKNGCGIIKGCKFYQCEAKNGGAVYTVDSMVIQDCIFRSCKAFSFASAVFYLGYLKSNLIGCEFTDCYPKRESVMQFIASSSERVITREETIDVSTILDESIKITALGILTISDAAVYIKRKIVCEGAIHIKNAKIIAFDEIEDKDLFSAQTARGVLIENSEFDGRLKAGILHVNGTRIKVINSVFRNCAGGRAIFAALDPMIENTIFSYCQSGAVHCRSGKIRDCTFVGCRGKIGAAVMMDGMNGEIRNCKFVRCKSEILDNPIDTTLKNKVIDCITQA